MVGAPSWAPSCLSAGGQILLEIIYFSLKELLGFVPRLCHLWSGHDRHCWL